MRSLTPTFGILRNLALVMLLVAVAACSRTPATGVGNLGPGSASPGSQQEFLVTVGDRVFFDTDSSDLTPTATATLDKQAVWLNHYSNYKILIEGHTDAVGSAESNQVLSERRAESLKRVLVREFGVPARALETVGYGEEFLLVPTQNENWQNRRVTLRRLDGFVR